MRTDKSNGASLAAIGAIVLTILWIVVGATYLIEYASLLAH